MTRRWILVGLPMVVVAVLFMLQGRHADRVELDPARRAGPRPRGSSTSTDVPSPSIRASAAVPAELSVKVTSTALEVLDFKVPSTTARAVNSWLDFESAISDLSRSRECRGDGTYRQEVLRMTADVLDLKPDEGPTLDSTLRIVQTDLRRLQPEAESRFQPGREAALACFDPFLNHGRERHPECRTYWGRWVTRSCGFGPLRGQQEAI